MILVKNSIEENNVHQTFKTAHITAAKHNVQDNSWGVIKWYLKMLKCLPSSQAQEENINWLQQNSEEEDVFCLIKCCTTIKYKLKVGTCYNTENCILCKRGLT